MKLLTASAWAEKYFAEGSVPEKLTVLRLLRDGKLPGRKVGGTWYVDEHAWLAGNDDLVRQVLDEAG